MKYRQASIADVFDMTVSQACGFLENLPKLRPKLETLREVGLGYVTLGACGARPTPSLCHLERHAAQFESITDANFD